MLALFAPVAVAQVDPVNTMRVLPGIAEPVSEHVQVIPANNRPGVPNVGIIVGTQAVLVVDTGLGEASGQVVLDELRHGAPDHAIYIVSTHAHPEHYSGEGAFPPDAVILRSVAQQAELDLMAAPMIAGFAMISEDNALLLDGFVLRSATVLFNAPITLDLGGVTVDIIAAGPAHTAGDLAVLVREDAVLFTGDVVQENYAPLASGADLATWLERIAVLEQLPAEIVVPSHTPVTDRASFAAMRDVVTFLHERRAELAAEGLDDTVARAQIVGELKQLYPGIANADLLLMPSMQF